MIEITLRGKRYSIDDWTRFSDPSVGIPDHIDEVSMVDDDGNHPAYDWTDEEWEEIYKAINEWERKQYHDLMENQMHDAEEPLPHFPDEGEGP